MKLYKGNCIIDGMKSDTSVYSKSLATYSAGDIFDQSASVGFIKIWGMPIKTGARSTKRKTSTPSTKLVMEKGKDATK